MVNVYTKNGQFNISESLMEAIKANNPELLVERKSSILKSDGTPYEVNDEKKETNKNDSDGNILSKIDIYRNQINNNMVISSDIANEINQFIEDNKNNDDQNIKQSLEDLQTVVKNKTDTEEIRAGIKSDELDDDIKNKESYINTELKYPSDCLGFTPLLKEINISEQKAKEIIHQAESEMTAVMGNLGRTNNPNSTGYDLQQFNNDYVSDEDLNNAAKEIEQQYGKAGKTPNPNIKKELEYILVMVKQNIKNKNYKNLIKHWKPVIQNKSLINKVFDYMKKSSSENYQKDLFINDTDTNSNINNQSQITKVYNNGINNAITNQEEPETEPEIDFNKLKIGNNFEMPSSSPKFDKFKNTLGLMTGGVRITPYFKNSGDKNKTMILRYFYDFIGNESTSKSKSNSYIQQMMNIFKNEKEILKNLNNMSRTPEEKDKKNVYQIDNNDENTINAFNHLVEKYLNSIAFKIEINNNAKYDNAVSAVRLDPKLNNEYIVRTISTAQQFNAKERVVGVLDKKTKTPCAIMVFKPLFAKGQEIMKPLEKAISGRVTEG